MVGTNLHNLVQGSSVLQALCSAPSSTLFPQGRDTGWIKPGRALWSWWDAGMGASLVGGPNDDALFQDLVNLDGTLADAAGRAAGGGGGSPARGAQEPLGSGAQPLPRGLHGQVRY